MFFTQGNTSDELAIGAEKAQEIYRRCDELLTWFWGTVFNCRRGQLPQDVVNAMDGRQAEWFRAMEAVCALLAAANALELKAESPRPSVTPPGWRYNIDDEDESVTLCQIVASAPARAMVRAA